MARATQEAPRKQIHFFADVDLYKRINTARMSESFPDSMRVNQFVKMCVENGVADVSKGKWTKPPASPPKADPKTKRYSIHFFADMVFYRKIHVALMVFPEPPRLKNFIIWCLERGIDDIYKRAAA